VIVSPPLLALGVPIPLPLATADPNPAPVPQIRSPKSALPATNQPQAQGQVIRDAVQEQAQVVSCVVLGKP